MTLNRQEYQKRVEIWLKEWQIGLEQLKAQTGRVSAEAKQEYQQLLQQLSSQQAAIQQRLEDLDHADSANWEKIKTDINRMMRELQQTFNQFKDFAQQYGNDVLGWAKGIAKEHQLHSIGWAEGIAKEDPLESIGWAEGVAKEDVVESVGWAEGYDTSKR